MVPNCLLIFPSSLRLESISNISGILHSPLSFCLISSTCVLNYGYPFVLPFDFYTSGFSWRLMIKGFVWSYVVVEKLIACKDRAVSL